MNLANNYRNSEDGIIRFDTIPACDGQTDGRTDSNANTARSIAVRFKINEKLKSTRDCGAYICVDSQSSRFYVHATLLQYELPQNSTAGFYPDALGLGGIASIGGQLMGVWGLCP